MTLHQSAAPRDVGTTGKPAQRSPVGSSFSRSARTGAIVSVFFAPAACVVSTETLPVDDGPFSYAENESDIYYNDGRLGLGTTSPVETLDVNARAATFSILPGRLTVGNSGEEYPSIGYNVIYTQNSGQYTYRVKDGASLLLLGDYTNGFVFHTTPVTGGGAGTPIDFVRPAAVIARNGNFGIGTGTPADRLHIGKGGGIRLDTERPPDDPTRDVTERSFRFRVNGQGTFFDTLFVDAQSADGKTFENVLTVHADGNVGIGTTAPMAKLHVAATSTSPGVALTNAGGGLALMVGSGGLESQGSAYLATDDASRVGIGTTSPQATLDVEGTARLARYSSPPTTCDAAHDGTIALTSKHMLCVCNASQWVRGADGTTSCTW